MNSNNFAVLEPYCENDMRKLKNMSRSIFMKFNEPLSNADYDDFYSVANLVLWQAYNSYDPKMGIKFEGFLHSCLSKKFKTELEYRHRQKRVLNHFAVSLDAASENDEEYCLMDCVASDFDTFEEVVRRQEKDQFQDKVQKYISRLSKQQIRILNMLMDGYKASEIRKILKISSTEYTENLHIMRSYENIKILF